MVIALAYGFKIALESPATFACYFDLKVVGCWIGVTAFVDVVTPAFYLLIHFYFLVSIVCL